MVSLLFLLFNEEKPWVKKGSASTFDVTMGSYDGAEICELVGLFILERLGETFGHENIGLYRDDGLAALKNVNGKQADKSRKALIEIFNSFGLKITVQTNQKVVNFLDITFNLHNGTFQPYRKPNDEPLYTTANQTTRLRF